MANYIIGAVIVVLVALALRRVIRQAKKPACCGDCGGCGCGKTDEKRITLKAKS